VSEYSIATFLKALTDDDLEKELIELIDKGFLGEELLEKILEIVKGKKNDKV